MKIRNSLFSRFCTSVRIGIPLFLTCKLAAQTPQPTPPLAPSYENFWDPIHQLKEMDHSRSFPFEEKTSHFSLLIANESPQTQPLHITDVSASSTHQSDHIEQRLLLPPSSHPSDTSENPPLFLRAASCFDRCYPRLQSQLPLLPPAPSSNPIPQSVDHQSEAVTIETYEMISLTALPSDISLCDPARSFHPPSTPRRSLLQAPAQESQQPCTLPKPIKKVSFASLPPKKSSPREHLRSEPESVLVLPNDFTFPDPKPSLIDFPSPRPGNSTPRIT